MAGKKQAVSVVEDLRPPILCYECDKPARMRTNRYYLGKVYRPLCFDCDLRLHREKAEAWCVSRGIVTSAQKIEYCRSMLGTFGVRKLERVPGEDDEVVAHA